MNALIFFSLLHISVHAVLYIVFESAVYLRLLTWDLRNLTDFGQVFESVDHSNAQ